MTSLLSDVSDDFGYYGVVWYGIISEQVANVNV